MNHYLNLLMTVNLTHYLTMNPMQILNLKLHLIVIQMNSLIMTLTHYLTLNQLSNQTLKQMWMRILNPIMTLMYFVILMWYLDDHVLIEIQIQIHEPIQSLK
ncbi:hypothetical protein G7084_03410 [Weissella coleopterorum]|uniref:Uncharacterized protein n=1 Tax=Weissella coleopterorum TaxID=2714949 RepID=A0A6G8AZF5_9LACO|nr:hypothetical protein G7084_03410 [Weissella coleopterorum]